MGVNIMVLKKFNIRESVYNKFSDFCKKNGVNMNKQVEGFMKSRVEEEPEVNKEYLKKLEKIRKGKFYKCSSIKDLEKL
jgi:rubrerythrin